MTDPAPVASSMVLIELLIFFSTTCMCAGSLLFSGVLKILPKYSAMFIFLTPYVSAQVMMDTPTRMIVCRRSRMKEPIEWRHNDPEHHHGINAFIDIHEDVAIRNNAIMSSENNRHQGQEPE
ncbi:hypothetical protein AYO21_07512 [Fonsecaea monophora]|uniref:Uncharacterized protein n=1 Tax=Fonsecaea monophora TaxID=254056 RepID=A0A177F382_9EURO|nr:hypothetical protein AYO21_07512 [Fonsecaea monophora]OAG38286.1 hypothetical protein AYO21_07512 [Fonsecaea monophora]